jgi:hypothetical protein
MMAQGGMAHYADGTASVQPSDAQSVPPAINLSQMNQQAPNAVPQEIASVVNPPVNPDQDPNPNGTALDPNSYDPYTKAVMLGNDSTLEATQNDINAEHGIAGVTADQGAAQAASAKAAVGRTISNAAKVQKNADETRTEVNNLVADSINNYIKPNHYVENMSVPAKVTTALGMIISGLGGNGGVNGGTNAASKYLDDQIARNIDAQKANQSQRLSLIGALQQQGHTDQSAAETAMAFEKMRNAQEALQLAGKYGGQKALFNAQQYAAQKMKEIEGHITNAAILKTTAEQSAGGAPAEIPDQLDPNRDIAYRVAGRKAYAKSPAEAQELQNESDAIDAIDQQRQRVDQFNKNVGRTILPFGANAGARDQINSDSNVLFTKTLANKGAGVSRLVDKIKGAVPEAGPLDQAGAVAKSQQLAQQLTLERANLLKRGLHGKVVPLSLGKKQSNTPPPPATSEEQ